MKRKFCFFMLLLMSVAFTYAENEKIVIKYGLDADKILPGGENK